MSEVSPAGVQFVEKPQINMRAGLLYSLPVICTTLLTTPILSTLPGIYAKYFGVALPLIAGAMLIGRLFDAVTDPLIGYLSDRYHARSGTRKPFMLLGCLIFVISAYFLYVPPAGVTPVYFLGWLLTLYLSWTAFQIPHLTWGGELSSSSIERNKIYSYRAAGVYLGLFLFYAIPFLPVFSTTDITPETLKLSALITAIVLPVFIFLSLAYVPNGLHYSSLSRSIDSRIKGCGQRASIGFKRSLMGNKPFHLFIGAYSFFGLAIGMWYGLIFIYVDAYLGLGDQFAPMFMLSFAISLPLVPVWYRFSAKLGKKTTWGVATLFFIIACIYTSFLSPGETSFYQLLLLKIITDFGFVCMEILPPSLLSDVIDYGAWKFRIERRGTYLSIYVFVTKTGVALGAALGLVVAGSYGFDPAASSFAGEAIFGLKLGISWLPVAFLLISIIFIIFSPMTERRHSVIQRRLQSRESRK